MKGASATIYLAFLGLLSLFAMAAPQAAPSSVVVKRFSEIPVEMASGELVQRESFDLRLKSRGLMLEVTRNYRSQHESAGLFGYGWGWNQGERLEFPGDFVIHYVTPDGIIPIIPDLSYTSAYARVCVAAPTWSQGNKATGMPDAFGGYGNVAHFYGSIASLRPLVVGGWGFSAPEGVSSIIQVDLASIGATAYDSDHPQYGLSLKLSAGGANSATWGHKAYDFDYVNITSDRASWTWSDLNAVQARLELASYNQNVPMDIIADTFHLGITYTKNSNGEYKYLPGSTFELTKTHNEYLINNKNKTQLAFDLAGKLLRKTDANGNTLFFHYDASGRLVRMTDALKQSITFSYEANFADAKVVRLEDHLGRSVGYAYRGGDLVAVTNVMGDVTHYAYAETEVQEKLRHNLISRTDPEGHGIEVSYHTTNSTPDRVCKYRDGERAEGRTNEVDYLYLKGTTYSWRPGSKSIQGVVYNASNDISQVYVREGELTYRESDGINLVAHHIPEQASTLDTSLWQNIEYARDGRDDLMAYQPALTTKSALEASGWGFLVPGMSNDIVQVVLSVKGLATNPVCLSAVGIASTNWSSINSAWVALDISRAKPQWTWADVAHLTARITLPNGSTNAVPVWLDGFSLKVSYRHFDPGSDPQDIFYFYDFAHNLVSSDRGGCAHQFAYDNRGNLVSWTDPEKNIRRYEYDPIFNKPIRSWDALGRVTTMDYDSVGRLVRTKDALGNESTLAYDAYGNVVRATDANGAVEETFYDGNGLNVVRCRNRRGFETAYDSDALGNCVRVVVPDGGRRHAVFNASGLKTSERDEAGIETQYEYDRNGLLIHVTKATGTLEESTEQQRLDGRGRSIEQIDPLGRSEFTEFDADGRPFCQIDKLGKQTLTEYDENGNVWRITDALGQTREAIHDERGNIRVNLDRRGFGVVTTYDRNNNPILILDKAGNQVTTAYDANGNKIVERFQWSAPPGSSQEEIPEPLIIAYAYDALNRVTNKTVGVGRRDAHVTVSSYNAVGQLISEIDSQGNNHQAAYDAAGNITNSFLTDAAGKLIEWESSVYDPADRLVMEIKAGTATNQYEYDLRGLRIATIDPHGHRTSFAYDRHRRPVSVIGPDGTANRMAYDRCGKKVSEKMGDGAVTGYEWDPAGRLTQKVSGLSLRDVRTNAYEYDPLGRVTSEINALGYKTFTTYDEEGNITSETNALGFWKTYSYDAAGRVTNTTDAMGYQLVQWLDGRGKLVKLQDKRGGLSASQYDVYGRMIRITDALGQSVKFGYDVQDNKVTETDPRGLLTRYDYDAANRVTNKVVGVGLSDAARTTTLYNSLGQPVMTETAGLSNSASTRIARVFDPAGNVLSMTDACGAVTSYAYDRCDRQVTERDAAGALTQTQYDSRGNVLARVNALGATTRFKYDVYGFKRTQTDNTGATTHYEYDQLGRLTNALDAFGINESQQFDAGNNLVKVTKSNGAVSEFDYDPLGRLTHTWDAYGFHAGKTYDPSGNVVFEDDKKGARTEYEYDALNRLVSVLDPASNLLHFAYDAGGNKVREAFPSGLIITYGYDGLGRLVLKTVGAGRADARRTRYELDYAGRVLAERNPLGQLVRNGYDANGNKTNVFDGRGFQTQFRYDSLNRLIQTRDALGYSANVEYDAMGRIVKTTNRRGATTSHQYDAEGRLLELLDAEGNPKRNRYDDLGRLIEEIEPNGLRIQSAFDSSGQLTNRTCLAPGGESRRESFQYDLLGRKVWGQDALGVVTEFIPDANGNVVTTLVLNANGILLRTKSAQYDSRNQAIVEVDYAEASWRTEYDSLGRKVATIDPLGNRTLYEWSVYNELVSTTDPAGNRSSIIYDRCGRESARINALGQRTRFLYDQNGNKTAVVDDNGKAVLTTYDALNRVSSVNRSLPDIPLDILIRADVNEDGQVDATDAAALEGRLQ